MNDSSVSFRLPPQDLEAEQCVLGSVLLENNAVYQVLDLISEDDFYRDAHKRVYSAIQRITEKNEPVDIITLQDELKRSNELDTIGGTSFLSEILAIVPTAANAAYYAKIVREKSIERKLLQACTSIVNDIYNSGLNTESLLNEAEARVFEVAGSKIQSSYSSIKDVVKVTFAKLEEMMSSGDDIIGVPSGYRDLDELCGGFKSGQLVVIAARPGVGKTALALNFARNTAIRHNKAVAIFSLEMSKEEVLSRLISSEARIDYSKFITGKIEDNEWGKLTNAAGILSETKIYIDDTSGITASEIRAKCRRIKSQLGHLDMIIVDYLQLMRPSTSKNQNREQEISEISRTMKEIAKELKVPVLALSQLNREVDKRPNKRPWLSDLRESGAIEQDSDMIMFIYRDDMYNPESEWKGIAEIIVAKNRSGPTKTIKLTWIARFTAFENYADEKVHEIGF